MIDGRAVVAARCLTLVLPLMLGVVLVLGSGGAGGQAGYFGDVSGTHEAGVDALAAEGLLEGTECGPGLLCPDRPIERWVIAVWLVRAVDGSDPVDRPVGRFGDVPSDVWWATHVERLAELGVTSGCGDGSRFCPDDPVTRGQMATFLVRAFKLDAAGLAGFGDVSGHRHENSIRILAAEGITAGCSTDPLLYCPNRSVTRGQMATFLARALDLISRPEPDVAGVSHLLFTTGSNELRMWASDGADPITVVDKNVHEDRILNPRLSPDGKTISYSLQETLELWVVGVDGSKRAKVSDLSHHYRWSPDGHRLWYVDVSTGELWVVDAEGSNNTILAAAVGGYSYARDPGWATWSPDGSRIAYEGRDASGYNRQLWVVDVDGTNSTKLVDEADRFVRWSPDGSRIAYTTGSADALWIVDVDGSNNRKLGDMNLASEVQRGALVLRSIYYWAPDGSGVVYNARVDTGRWDELWMVDVDSSKRTKLADYVDGWYPYGSHIAYLINGGELWVVDVDSSNSTRLDDDVRWPPGLTWSPSGTHIAYLKDDRDESDGRMTIDLWIVDSDGSNRERLVDGRLLDDGLGNIGWLPDESHIAYTSDWDDSPLGFRTSDFWLVDVANLTILQLVDDKSYYSWSPDGSLVAYVASHVDGDGNLGIQLWVQDVANHNKRLITGDAGVQHFWVSAHCYGPYHVYPLAGHCYRGVI